ncbi:MAG: 3-hydroxyacyl-CoA dehydrogenase family protein [Promethearchaeota archaeon]
MKIKTISIIGTGFMGDQIASRAILYDYKLKLYDINEDNLNVIRKSLTGFLRRRRLKKKLEWISFHTDLAEAVSDADLIIEVIPEKLELKKEIFKKIDELAPPNAIIATNSSSIPVSKIEDSVKRKEQVLNIHFYAPIIANPMVDIMRGTQTTDIVFEIGKKWIESLECTPLVVKKECLGFVFNRVWHAVKKECLKIWAGGYADKETVDTAWKIFTGMGLGPFRLMDGVGLDVIYNVEMTYFNESGNPDDEPPKELKEMVDKGLLGRKSGKGFYSW